MTRQEAIDVIYLVRIHRMQCEVAPSRLDDALDIALNVLDATQEQEGSNPLTLDELREMDGEPVWVEDLKKWALVKVDDCGTWKDKPYIKGLQFEWDAAARGLRCYRYKPER